MECGWRWMRRLNRCGKQGKDSMMLRFTCDDFPVLLDRRTKRKIIGNDTLSYLPQHWISIQQTPSGRWQAWTNGGKKGEQVCIAGSKYLALIMPETARYARKNNIVIRKTDLLRLGAWLRHQPNWRTPRPDGLMDLENEKIEDLYKSLSYHKREILLMRKCELRHETQGVIESIQWELRWRKRK